MIKFTTFAIVTVGLFACTDSLDSTQRHVVGSAVSTAVDSLGLYLELDTLDQQPPAGRVTGTRASYLVDGALRNPWGVASPSVVTGTGSVIELDGELELIVALTAWRDELWGTTLDGELEITEAATYRQLGDPFPNDITKRVIGELAMSDGLAGGHRIDLVICYRDIYAAFVDSGNARNGFTGTVDGEPASAHTSGYDEACEPQ